MKENTWKVVYIASRQEKKVAQKLALLNIECFLPLYKKLSQWSDRKKWVEVPLFNGYLFVRPIDSQREKVLEQSGVVAYVRYNGEDAKVQDDEIEVIKTVLISGYSLETINTPDDFELGESVMVNEGPLKGQKVDIIRRNNEEEFLVSFDTLGQSIKISLPYHIFRKTN
ncbi:MAG: UpxY family transcription antiterminator [Bacteroidia bacterium]|nr:UpxY family transcription antiterminator [Bacteroidia bacterium]